MPSRKTLLLGAGAFALVVLLVVLVTGGRGDPSPTIKRGDGSEFPLRGSLANDKDAIDDALEAWKDRRGGPAHSKAARVDDDEDVHLLYAGRVGERGVVIVSQGRRLIAMHEPLDRGWFVGAAKESFDAFDGSPVLIDGAVLLPAGDWTYLALRDRDTPPQNADGLISNGSAYGGDVDPGFLIGGPEPPRDKIAKVFDTAAGLFRVDAANHRRIMDAARQRGRLMAIHAALAGGETEGIDPSDYRTFDVLWTGKLAGVQQAAVVSRSDPRRLGLGLVEDPDGFVSSAVGLSLGDRTGPLGRRRDGSVGAAYVVGDDNEPQTLVAAATGPVDRIELLVGSRRLTRPGPVAVVPVDWDPATTDAVVVGRTAGGDVIAPLVPQEP